MATKTKVKKQKLSECCKAPMIKGVQCENCGSNGKFTSNTAIVRKLDALIDLITFAKKHTEKEDNLIPKKALVDDRFVEATDGTIKDTKTRLMWQKEGSKERLTYAQAEEFVAELNKEQYSDWRIPTREELESILDLSKHEPAINPVFKCESAGYWSSTPYAAFPGDFAWLVYFLDGYVVNGLRGVGYYVRPCRQY